MIIVYPSLPAPDFRSSRQ